MSHDNHFCTVHTINDSILTKHILNLSSELGKNFISESIAVNIIYI